MQKGIIEKLTELGLDLVIKLIDADPEKGTREYISIDSSETDLHSIGDIIDKIAQNSNDGDWMREYTTTNHTDIINLVS